MLILLGKQLNPCEYSDTCMPLMMLQVAYMCVLYPIIVLPNIAVRGVRSHERTRMKVAEGNERHSSFAAPPSTRQQTTCTLGTLKATGATQPYNIPVIPFYTSEALT
jgi:hypothetical protein